MELIVVSADITLCSELSVLSLPQILGSFWLAGHSKWTQWNTFQRKKMKIVKQWTALITFTVISGELYWTSIQPLYLQIIISGCDTFRSRLSLRAMGWIFTKRPLAKRPVSTLPYLPLATRIINPGYFHKKKKRKKQPIELRGYSISHLLIAVADLEERPGGPAPIYF